MPPSRRPEGLIRSKEKQNAPPDDAGGRVFACRNVQIDADSTSSASIRFCGFRRASSQCPFPLRADHVRVGIMRSEIAGDRTEDRFAKRSAIVIGDPGIRRVKVGRQPEPSDQL